MKRNYPISLLKNLAVIKELAKNAGIIQEVKNSNKGNNSIDSETKKIVTDFYLHDDISRPDKTAKSTFDRRKKRY